MESRKSEEVGYEIECKQKVKISSRRIYNIRQVESGQPGLV